MPRGVYIRDSMVGCAVRGCHNPHLAKGLCSLHWQRKKAGIPFHLPPYTKDKLKRVKVKRPSTLPKGWISRGYKFFLVGGKRVAEQRIVVETFLGRKLLSSEVIHHRDEDKLNNNLSNLQIVTRSEHRAIHNKRNSR